MTVEQDVKEFLKKRISDAEARIAQLEGGSDKRLMRNEVSRLRQAIRDWQSKLAQMENK